MRKRTKFYSSERSFQFSSTEVRLSLRGDEATLITFTALLRLHHAHLLKATREHPENASKSPFAKSVMTSYRSASAILAMWLTSYEALVS
jgi:hypothetical protein